MVLNLELGTKMELRPHKCSVTDQMRNVSRHVLIVTKHVSTGPFYLNSLDPSKHKTCLMLATD